MKTFLLTCLTVLAFSMASCGNAGSGELTRALAAELLNKRLASPSISAIGFQNDGLTRAVNDGVLAKEDWNDGVFTHTRYRFTEKGLKMVGGFLADGADKIESGAYGATAFGNTAPVLHLKVSVGETVSAVTGIAKYPNSTTYAGVTFTTAYTIPTEMSAMRAYIFTGRTTTALFTKYDDGWRVAEVEH